MVTYWWLGKLLKPLEDLACHMDRSNSENVIQEAHIESSIQEFDSLIYSFNGLSRKLKQSFETQKQFSSYVAHEFRIPLAIMQTKLDVYNKSQNKDTEGLILNFSKYENEHIIGNHELLYQAFLNIVQNAIKYNIENGIVNLSIHIENQSSISIPASLFAFVFQ